MSKPSTTTRLTFNRLHIPSGRLTTGTFEAIHDEVFAWPEGHSHETLERIKLRIINRWNRQQPTEWKYWI